MRLSHQRMTELSVVGCSAWVLVVVPALLPGVVAAQVPGIMEGQSTDTEYKQPPAIGIIPIPEVATVQPDDKLNVSRRSGTWFEPSITVQHTATSNVRLDASARSDQLTEVIPGFRWVSDTARIKGFLDYSLRMGHYARGTVSDQVWHNLNAKGSVEAVENQVFVDVYAVSSLQPISAFGAPGNFSPANPNMAQTSSFRLSPYVMGNFANGMDYELRYGVQHTRSDADNRSDVTVNDWLVHVGDKPVGQVLGWGVDAAQQSASYTYGRDIDSTTLRARVSYLPTPQLIVAAIGGYESTNQLSPVRESHDIFGFGFDWRPSDRTRVFFERENRYFGESHNAIFEHRTSRTVWRYTDQRGVTSGLVDPFMRFGALSDLLDGFYSRAEPNPIRRAQLVREEIERMGLQGDMQVSQDFLTSSATLQRLQQLSLALLGQRSALVLALLRSNTRLLDGALRLGDDFDFNRNIRQRGWSVMFAHRLTQNSSISANLGESRSIGTLSGLETRVRSLMLGWNIVVAPRTNLGLQLRRILSDGASNRFGESAIMGFITHRF